VQLKPNNANSLGQFKALFVLRQIANEQRGTDRKRSPPNRYLCDIGAVCVRMVLLFIQMLLP